MKRLPLLVLLALATPARADWPTATRVEAQPLIAQVRRLSHALDALGQPLPAAARKALAGLKEDDGDAKVAAAVQKALDPLCLAAVVLGKDGLEAAAPARKARLVEQGWRALLVKVVNGAGSTGRLRLDSPSARPLPGARKEEVAGRWLGLLPYAGQPLLPNLSGLGLEYAVVQCYSRDAGPRSADVTFRVEGGKGPAKGATVRLAFEAAASVPVTFHVTDERGEPATACFVLRGADGHVYPAQPKRLAPDFSFHPQVYRATGEVVRLPAGAYTVTCSRGPESVPEVKELRVGDRPTSLRYQVKRWIDPARRGWFSGDHHIHAAGCLHYERPTEGVEPADMMRHVLGEDLKVGCCLTWGPCFDYQKRFFRARPDPVSRYPYLLRYDVEVSGFGSHASGHLNLLRLTEQIPAGGRSKHHWPTLGMNTLRWAKRQGAVCGPAHSANGLTRTVGRIEGATDGPGKLPNYDVPAYDGIGANEYVVQAALTVPGPDGKPVPAVDFISTMDTDRRAELNMWYHTLNCGLRVRASGETDFPCITGERVGWGRVYVKVTGKLDFDRWAQGIAEGRSYVSDGHTHLMDFTAEAGGRPLEVGASGSEVRLDRPGKVRFTVRAAARYPGRKCAPVELVVNGLPVAKQELPCDGKERLLTFDAQIEKSSWVAVRLFPGGHANPFFVVVGGKPIRASRDSARWCLAGIDQCWKMKAKTYRKEERKQAEDDYEAARKVYRAVLAETAGKTAPSGK